jgi:hypothetical protein
MKTHTIHWKSLINGKIGRGTLLFEKEEAERLAQDLNQDYPGIFHEAVMSVRLPVEPLQFPVKPAAAPLTEADDTAAFSS